MRLVVVRYLVLVVPVLAVAMAAWRTRPDQRRRGAALLAGVAAAVGLAGLHAVAVHIGWWRYRDVDGSVFGLPVDVWLGWAVLWGALPVLVRIPLPMLLIGALWLDVVAMPALQPLVELGPQWIVGELVGLGFVALPAALLGRWVADDRRLRARATLQVVVFAGLVAWLVPALAIEFGNGSWRHLIDLPRWALSLVVQLAALVALPGLLAVREFVERGNGTPYPWDPPRRLVTTGPYGYLANPMQASGVGLLFVIAGVTHSWSVAMAALVAIAFSIAVAGPHEREDLTRRHGAAWSAYRAQVQPWWPRWRPYVGEPARLYLAASCPVCRSTALALDRLVPVALAIGPAEGHPTPLRRALYSDGGYSVAGVAAVARGFEHVHLGWALVGWTLRVPGLDRLVQITVDGLGGGPRDLPDVGVRGSRAWPTPDKS